MFQTTISPESPCSLVWNTGQKGRCAVIKTPGEIWADEWVDWNNVIRYCDGSLVDPYAIKMIKIKYGDQSPRLRQFAKDKLKEAFLRYWETI